MGHDVRIALVMASVVGCGATKAEPKTAINPESVPSLALLGGGAGVRGSEVTGSGEGKSCEEVNNAELRKAEQSGTSVEEPPEEQLDAIKAVLDEGSYLNACEVSSSSAVELCVAIIDGRADGVTVTMSPGDQAQADCVADEIRKLDFPAHELVSIARTQFEPG